MTSSFHTYALYNAVADNSVSVNWLNNGGFTAYDRSLVFVEDLSITRKGFDRTDTIGHTQAILDKHIVDMVDISSYVKETYTYAITSTVSQPLGYWNVSGVSGSLIVNPKINGVLVPAYDGGNQILIQSSSTGSVTLEQSIEYILPLLSSEVSLGVSGKKYVGQVKIEVLLLVDGSEIGKLQTQSQFFGFNKRIFKSIKMPDKGSTFTVKIVATGSGNWSVGLSAVSLVLGNNSYFPFTPSIADVIIPSNTVIMVTGDSCPLGYKEISTDSRMALVAAGPSNAITSTVDINDNLILSVEYEGGSADHDHNPDNTLDCLNPADASDHLTNDTLPEDGRAYVHAVKYKDPTHVSSWFPSDRPTVGLGISHSHIIQSNMTSVPPVFPVKFCRKI